MDSLSKVKGDQYEALVWNTQNQVAIPAFTALPGPENIAYCGQELKYLPTDPFHNERIPLWDTHRGIKLAGRSAPMRRNVTQYLRKRPSIQLYSGQDKDEYGAVKIKRISLWNKEKKVRIRGKAVPNKDRLRSYLNQNEHIEIYQGQDRSPKPVSPITPQNQTSAVKEKIGRKSVFPRQLQPTFEETLENKVPYSTGESAVISYCERANIEIREPASGSNIPEISKKKINPKSNIGIGLGLSRSTHDVKDLQNKIARYKLETNHSYNSTNEESQLSQDFYQLDNIFSAILEQPRQDPRMKKFEIEDEILDANFKNGFHEDQLIELFEMIDAS